MPLQVSANDDGSGSKGCKEASNSMLSGEVNIDSIRGLDQQIREHEEAIMKLKHARNSLLNIHRLSPEVLGNIFLWNVALKGEFDRLQVGSHNFLRVCKHWFEVALSTPEIWSFWGDTPKDWAKWHHYSRTAPLDLVLRDRNYRGDCLDDNLLDVLQDRANRDTIRRVHIESKYAVSVGEILSSLTPECKEIRSNRIESLILHNRGNALVDLSNFLATCRFPELRYLELFRCKISSWDHLMTRTGALTNLILTLSSPAPTTSQCLSIFSSNPTLQQVEIKDLNLPEGTSDTSSPRVVLRNLESLILVGDSQPVYELLDQLDHPTTFKMLAVTLHHCTLEDTPKIAGSHLREHLRRLGSPQNGLGLEIPCRGSIEFSVSDVRGMGLGSVEMNEIVRLNVEFDEMHCQDLLWKGALELLAHTPSEDIVHLQAYDGWTAMCDTFTRLPNLKMLHLTRIRLSPLLTEFHMDKNKDILPSLQYLVIQGSAVASGDWDPLMSFLAHRASSGKRLRGLKASCRRVITAEVQEGIKGLVDDFVASWQ